METFTSYLIVGAGLLLVVLAISWYRIAHSTSLHGDLSPIKSPLVIFDFDGTLCPSYPLFIEQVNFLADEYDLTKISDDESEEFKDLPAKKMMEKIGVSMFTLPFLMKKARYNIQKKLLDLKPVDGIVDILKQLKQQGYSLGILTSNSTDNVLAYLHHYGMDFFDFIYAGNNIFGKDKHLKSILKKSGLHPEESRVIYVGDETRDVEAAKKVFITAVGVTWGYNSLKILQESDADILCNTPEELLNGFEVLKSRTCGVMTD